MDVITIIVDENICVILLMLSKAEQTKRLCIKYLLHMKYNAAMHNIYLYNLQMASRKQ